MAWTDDYLAALRRTGLETTARRVAGVTKRQLQAARDADELFQAQEEEALELWKDVLEEEAYRRAVEGTDRPVIYKGEVTDYYKEYSDTLLLALLKANRKSKFADRQELTGAGGTPITVLMRTFAATPTGEVIEAQDVTGTPVTATGTPVTATGTGTPLTGTGTHVTATGTHVTATGARTRLVAPPGTARRAAEPEAVIPELPFPDPSDWA